MADRQGIIIKFGAAIADFFRGKSQVQDGLKDVGTSLEDVNTQGSDAGDKLDDIGDKAEGATGKLGDLGQVGAQALSGDLGGAAESAAGALSTLGPAGAVAGTIAAAGIGLVTKELDDQQKRAEKLTSYFSGVYKGLIEGGKEFIDESVIQKEVLDIIFNPDRVDEYQQAQKDAADTGLSLTTVLRAQAGDTGALNTALDTSTKLLEAATKKRVEAQTFTGGGQGHVDPVVETAQQQVTTLGLVVGRLQAVKDAQDAQAQNATIAGKIISDSEAAQQTAIGRTSDADTARWQAYQANVEKAKQPIVVPLTPDTTAVDDAFRTLNARARAGLIIPLKGADQYGKSLN